MNSENHNKLVVGVVKNPIMEEKSGRQRLVMLVACTVL